MPRKSLEQRAQEVTKLLAGRQLDALPKYVLRQVELLEKGLGLSSGTFLGYSARTRQRYISGAKAGRTAKQTREREAQAKRESRARKTRIVAATPQQDPRWKRVLHLRSELQAEGINVVAGVHTQMDRMGHHDLYSDASLVEHVKVYGFTYVIERMEHQLAAVQQYNQSGGRDRGIGRDAMMQQFGTAASRDFAASRSKFLDDDERWFWYHASMLHYGPPKLYYPPGKGPK